MYTDEEILELIKQMLNSPSFDPNILRIKIYNNYNSLEVDGKLFARIKRTKQSSYISFKVKYKQLFEMVNIPYSSIASEKDYIRLSLNIFSPLEVNQAKLAKILLQIYNDTLNTASFGCCSKYVLCSDEKRCLHNDLIYSFGCMYRKNLEEGRIFYGKNKNYP